MSNILTLSPEVIAAYKIIIEEPGKHGFTFRPLKECFEESEIGTAKHILFKEYVDYIEMPLPKVIFYIIMDALFPVIKTPPIGDYGYPLKFKPEET